MGNNIKYIAKYQKENTIQVNIRLSKKYDTNVIAKLNSLDNMGKSTYIKRLILADIERSNGEGLTEESEVPDPDDKRLTIAELAVAIGSGTQTITNWYRWKRENPENEYAKLLPDFVRGGAHRTRYWYESDITRILEFKNSIPQGRNGIMGSVTQKYVKKNADDRGAA